MEFSVEFYETSTGHCPVREFLDELKDSDPDDFACVLAGLGSCGIGDITASRFPKRSLRGSSSCATSAN